MHTRVLTCVHACIQVREKLAELRNGCKLHAEHPKVPPAFRAVATCMHARMHAYVHACMHVRMHACVCARMRACTRACARMRAPAHVRAYMHAGEHLPGDGRVG